MADRRPVVLPFESLNQPLSPLFLDYQAGRPAVAPFLGTAGFGLDAIASTAEAVAARGRPVETLAAALIRQQDERGARNASANAARLRQPGAVAVVTGQQAGLFGGPLFVLHKAIATLQIAQALEKERGRPAVPVFWVASDDHDFAEVRTTSVLDAGGQIRPLRYDPHHEPTGQPAWRIELDETITTLVGELKALVPPSPHRGEVLGSVESAYRPGQTLSGAFARLISAILPELVVLDPADPALKALMVPVLARELREVSPTSRFAIAAGPALLAAGYHQQVPVRPAFFNLFLLVDGERRALAAVEGRVEVRGSGLRLEMAEALRLLEAEPERWSPAALLRPLAQDAILPTAAYIGGPAEIAYHAQIGACWADFGLPRPALVPRPSVTLLEPAQARALEAEGLRLTDLEADPEALVARWAREAYPEVEGAFARARESLESEMAGIEERLAVLDPTLRGAAASARGRALHQLEGLHEKAMRALKKRDQGRAERLRRTRDALFPGGALQERGLGLVGALARHGFALVEDLRRGVDPWARGHQVVTL